MEPHMNDDSNTETRRQKIFGNEPSQSLPVSRGSGKFKSETNGRVRIRRSNSRCALIVVWNL